jgi:hypothetical protein
MTQIDGGGCLFPEGSPGGPAGKVLSSSNAAGFPIALFASDFLQPANFLRSSKCPKPQALI